MLILIGILQGFYSKPVRNGAAIAFVIAAEIAYMNKASAKSTGGS